MNLVLAISQVDLKLSHMLVKRFQEIGRFDTRLLLVVSTWKDHFDVQPVADFCKTFARSEFLIVDDPEIDEWPQAPTHMFIKSAEWLHEHGNDQEWFFWEPDVAPLRPDFLALFEHEYKEAGKSYMGVKNTAIIQRISTGEYFSDMEHMVGAGIYPPDFLDRCKSIQFCDHWPWDCAIGKEILPDLHDTNLLAHRWHTRKWHRRKLDDPLIYGEIDEKAKEMHAKDPLPIGPEVAAIHGSKDDSIFRLALPTVPA